MSDYSALTHTSKFISLILRHNPSVVGVTLDQGGWIEVEKLLAAMNAHGHKVDIDTLNAIVASDRKGRYTVKDGKIRANQGHSIEVELDLAEATPTGQLYHGTSRNIIPTLMAEGLKKMQRHHVHLSGDVATATNVAKRRGKEYTVLSVDTTAMMRDGHKFYRSENGVWLAEHVPPQYLKVVVEGK
jgi:putative RNA 2'-phosphotransferase